MIFETCALLHYRPLFLPARAAIWMRTSDNQDEVSGVAAVGMIAGAQLSRKEAVLQPAPYAKSRPNL